MPEERDLLDIGRDTPCARGPGGKEYDVAWAEPTFFALPIGNEGLAGDDDKSLVLVVMTVEAPGRALPDHAVRGTVRLGAGFMAGSTEALRNGGPPQRLRPGRRPGGSPSRPARGSPASHRASRVGSRASRG